MSPPANPDPFSAQALSWRGVLKTKPIKNPAVEVKTRTEKAVCLLVTGKRPRFLVPPLSWIIRPRLTHRVWLDQVGMELWDRCDGTRDLEAIVDWFASANELSFHEARVAVTQYLRELTRRGVIAALVSP